MKNDLVDYAYPTMMAEKQLKNLHSAMLRGDFETAKECALQCLVEVKMAYNAVVVMEEENVRKAPVSA